MLRRCVSTVLRLRNRVAAISALVRRSTTRRATSQLACGQRRDADAVGRRGRVRRWIRRPSRRSSRSASSRQRGAPQAWSAAAARCELRAARSRVPAAARRAARRSPASEAASIGPGGLGGGRRRAARARPRARGVARVERDAARRAVAPSPADPAARPRPRRPRRTRRRRARVLAGGRARAAAGRAARARCRAIRRGSAGGPSPPAAPSSTATARSGSPRSQQRGGERSGRPYADEARRRAPARASTLSSAAPTRCRRRRPQARPAAWLTGSRPAPGRCRQPRGLDGAVEELGRLGQSARRISDGAEHGDEQREQVALAGRAADREGPLRRAGAPPRRRSRYSSAPARCATASSRARQLLVGQRVDERGGAPRRCAAARRWPPVSAARRARATPRPPRQRGSSSRPPPRAPAPPSRASPSYSTPVEGVRASSIISATALRRVAVRSRSSAPARRSCASSCRPSRCSTPAQATISRTRCAASPARRREALEQRGVRCRRTGRSRPARRASGEQELDPLVGGRGLGQEPQRGAEPAAGARRGARRGGVARRRAGPPRRRCRPAGRSARRGGRARRPARRARPAQSRARSCAASRQPPGGRVVDRAAHERVAEAEAPRDVGRRARGPAAATRRARPTAVVLREPGRRCRELEVERVAGHRRARRAACASSGDSSGELLGQRRGHHRAAPRSADADRRAARPPAPAAGRARELLEVERVAAALAVQRGRRSASTPSPSSVAGCRRAQRARLEPA